MGIRQDKLGIVDAGFILCQFGSDRMIARRQYIELLHRLSGEGLNEDSEFKHERAEYRSERNVLVRNTSPMEVVDFVATYTRQDKSLINIKYTKMANELKSLSALLMRGLCNMKQKDICREMGSITQTSVSRLCVGGLKLINENNQYSHIIRDFIARKAS